MSQAEEAPLRMIRLPLETRRLHSLWQRRRLLPHRFDAGYLVHCLLGELFQDIAPRPFSLPPEAPPHGASQTAARQRPVTLPVLAYSRYPLAALEEHARAFAEPSLYQAVLWRGTAEKPMPESWPAGRRLGFALRACPVVRIGSGRPGRADGGRGVEVDAFLARCWRAEDARTAEQKASGFRPLVDRGAVYRDWLAEQLERRGGARLIQADLARFQLEPLVRRTQGEQRKTRDGWRPDAHFHGLLEVTDEDGFARLLAGGIGRHRAFGFGMLLLRPAGEA